MSSILFIDARVQDWESLIAGLAADVQVVLLDPVQDGIEQIAVALQGVTDLDAIHIISHGTEGTLYLGDTVLTSENLSRYRSELQTIGTALKETGDILLYGCQVASGTTGQSFIDNLALYTKADVAASTDLTGSTALNGDWVLEGSSGTIETQVIAPVTQEAFDGVLSVPTLTPAGTLDKSFDTDGKLTTAIGAGHDRIQSMTLQGDGKIVVAGSTYSGANGNFALARYNTDGTLDTAFDADGKLTTAIGTGTEEVFSLALQADGKIVAAGSSYNGANDDFALVRYNTDGTLDTTFDDDGRLTTAIDAGADVLKSVALQADGKIVAAGYSNDGFRNEFALARYNADGTLDTTFSGDGKQVTTHSLTGDSDAEIRSLALQADGKILAAGRASNGFDFFDFTLVRYNANGTLDTTFSEFGVATTAVGLGDDELTCLALQADGKIVAAGYSDVGPSGYYDFALVRYNPDGTLDTTFDGDGKLTTSIGTGIDVLTSVALQADGKIVAAGYSRDGTNEDFALVRYNTNGTLDTTFDGDGKLTIPAGTGVDRIQDLVLQADGAIVGGGYSRIGANDDFALVRVVGGGTAANSGIPDVIAVENATFSFTFNANTFTDPEGGVLTYAVGALPAWLSFDAATRTFSGTPGTADVGSTNITVTAGDAETFSVSDTFAIKVGNNDAPTSMLDKSFSADGKVTTALSTTADQIVGLVLQADGKIVAAGTSGSANPDFAVVRYNADGTLDTTFSSDGMVITAIGVQLDVCTSVALQADGKIVAAGFGLSGPSDPNFTLVRYNTNGTLDTTFDGDGMLMTSFNTGTDTLAGIVLQADGKIVAAGQSTFGGTVDFALARFNTNGTLDSTFSGNGWLTTAIGTGTDRSAGLALQNDGKIVVAGFSYNGANDDFALARYNTDGTLDSTFDGDGKLTTAIGTGADVIAGVVLQSDGKIVVAGSSFNGANDDFALARYNTDGTLDSTFDGDGKLTTAIGAGADVLKSIALQADGKIVVAGSSHNGANTDFALARYNIDGTLDTTFDGDGKFTVPAGVLAANSVATSIRIQDNGAIVVGGVGIGIDGTQDFSVIRLVASSGIADKSAVHSIPLSYSAAFIDPEGGQVVYSAILTDGAPLPSWLTLQPSSGDFSGLPAQINVGRYDINVTAKDIHGVSNSDIFSLAVTNINGTSGNDTLYGGLGADTVSGLGGNDLYIVDDSNDSVSDSAGFDTVRASVNYDLSARAASVENLIFAGSGAFIGVGNGLDNNIAGNTGNDTLNGVAGNDTLIGGGGDDVLWGGDGDDSLSGGEGIDIASYVGTSLGVTVSLAITGAQNTIGAGTDTLGSTFESLEGGNFNDTLTGNSAANQLDGGAGNDTLDGGLGNDTLKGGSGNDTYKVNAAGDIVIENAGAGTDSVQSSVTHTLAANVEHLTLTGVGNASGNGNSLANQLTGNSGNNTLNGGLGNDTMTGGLGNDTYVVNAAGDVVTEAAAAGTDSVQASTSHTLQANVENLTLTGAGNSSGNGNTQDNLLTGNSKNNALNGGSGNDTMVGGAGNDTYSVNAAGDQVIENADAGTDTVNTAINYTLTVNVENLTQTGSANTSGTGNTQDNKLSGNSGNNTLIGNGGADTLTGGSGADTLTGGTGIDIFDYNALTDAGDTITDFTAGAGGDKLDIDTLLTALGYGGADPIAAGYVQLLQAGAHTQVNIDSNGGGDSFATTLITLQNVTAASVTLADNFIV
jgi:uncharacterized delta-60 repeat protein